MKLEVKEVLWKDLIKELPKLEDENVCFVFDWSSAILGLKYYAVLDQKTGKYIAGFCLKHSKRKGLNHVSNPSFLQNIGLTILHTNKSGYEALSYKKRVIQTVSDFLNEFNWVNISLPPTITDLQPMIWNSFSVTPMYTYVLELKEEQVLRSNMKKGLLKDMASVAKSEIDYSNEFNDRVISVLEESTIFHRGSEERKEWNNIKELISSKEVFQVTEAKLEKHSGAACVAIFGNTGLYLFGGSDKVKGVPLGTASLWKAILEARESGVIHFDFEGSMIPGVEHYFRSFGADQRIYFNVEKKPKVLKIKDLM